MRLAGRVQEIIGMLFLWAIYLTLARFDPAFCPPVTVIIAATRRR
jgi:hypothetical protein